MIVHFGDRPFDADWIAFDKDGTLLAFEVMWGRLAQAWIKRLAGEAGQETDECLKNLREEIDDDDGLRLLQERLLSLPPNRASCCPSSLYELAL